MSEQSRSMFLSKLAKVEYLSPDDIKVIEKSIHDYVYDDVISSDCKSKFDKLYLVKAKAIFLALHESQILKDNIKSGNVKLEDLVKMTPRDLRPERWTSYNKEEEKEVNQVLHGDLRTRTKLYVCSRCKGNNCAYVEKYTRSGDEGSVLHFECLDCPNRWKIYN